MDMDRTRLSWDRCLIVSKLQELSRCVNKCGEDCAVLKGLASVRSIPFLSFIEPIFAGNVPCGISNFFEEISSLSHSIIFLYFFTLITEEGFLISPCYSMYCN